VDEPIDTVCVAEYVPDGSDNHGVAVEVLEMTLILISTWSFTCCPQHFTCRTWAPDVALTEAVNEVGSITAAPLSIE
jgi:hypothetical protein